MKRNIGEADRYIRLGLALLILLLYYTDVLPASWAFVLGIIGFILVLTSFLRFCPIYWPFGLSTIKKKSSKSAQE